LLDSDAQVSRAAEDSLASLTSPEVDRAVLALIGSADPAQRVAGIDLVGRRRMSAAVPALCTAMGDADAKVRVAAIRRVGELGGSDEVAPLLRHLGSAAGGADSAGIEQSLNGIIARLSAPGSVLGQLAAALATAKPSVKQVLLRVVGTVGTAEALPIIRAALTESSPEVRVTAIRTLGMWKTEDATPILLDLAKSTTDATEKKLAVRGYLGWAQNTDLSVEKRLAICRDAASMIESDDLRQYLLGALGSIRSVEALPLILPHLRSPTMGEPAAVAIVSIAEPLLKGPTDAQASVAIRDALQKASETGTDPEVAKRILKNLEEAKSRVK
jgi:HEAT repeat protein